MSNAIRTGQCLGINNLMDLFLTQPRLIYHAPACLPGTFSAAETINSSCLGCPIGLRTSTKPIGYCPPHTSCLLRPVSRPDRSDILVGQPLPVCCSTRSSSSLNLPPSKACDPGFFQNATEQPSCKPCSTDSAVCDAGELFETGSCGGSTAGTACHP